MPTIKEIVEVTVSAKLRKQNRELKIRIEELEERISRLRSFVDPLALKHFDRDEAQPESRPPWEIS